MTNRVRDILSWYSADNAGVKTNLARILNHGALKGTGKCLILPVDQGFEHGPARSFAVNPPGYDPRYHFELAVEAGCNAHAAPLGFLETGAAEFAGEIPLILKLNNHDVLYEEKDPVPSLTGSVRDALRLGCVAVGFTIYPGSEHCKGMYEQAGEIGEEAKRHGLAFVIWYYPRGSQISKEGETALDVVAYAAQIAAQLGAHIIKVKLPTDHLEQGAAKKVYDAQQIPIKTLAERVRHVVQSAFDGRRIVIFSGGAGPGWPPMGHAVPEAPSARRPAAVPLPPPAGADHNFVEVAKAVTPAVVNIATTRLTRVPEGHSFGPFDDPFFRRFFGDEFFRRRFEAPQDRRERSLGSGVIADPSGYIITNNHVVSKADEIRVLLSDKRELKAKVVGPDPKTDIAVIQVDAKDLPTIPWADSDRLQVGEYVLAIGNPFGLNQTVTMGIVSAVGRANVGIAEYEDFIQTDAAINPGNSGGALVN